MSDVPAAKIALIGTLGAALIGAGVTIYAANRGNGSDPPADPVRVAAASVAVDAASFYVRCPFTVTFTGTIDVQSGTGQVVYRWVHSDGANQPMAVGERQTVAVDGPGNVTLTDQWIANVPMGDV